MRTQTWPLHQRPTADSKRLKLAWDDSITDSKRLNVGCGARFHSDWVNLDLQPVHPSVLRWDITRPLPFDDGWFDVVYHSHLLEHLQHEQALPFLRDCHRVLKRDGVLRVAIPDLEATARLYLQALDEAWDGDRDALARHRWLVMELYDQTTRDKAGGEMLQYLRGGGATNLFAWHRLGEEAEVIRRHFQNLPPLTPTTFRQRCQARLRGWLLGSWRERLIRWLLGREYPLLQVGRFRRTGEVHQWMYDRVALRDLLTQVGFAKFRCAEPTESDIPNWIDFHLDTTPDGAVYKPDSLFVEARKP